MLHGPSRCVIEVSCTDVVCGTFCDTCLTKLWEPFRFPAIEMVTRNPELCGVSDGSVALHLT